MKDSENRRVAIVVVLTMIVYFSAEMVWSVSDPSRNQLMSPIDVVADDSSLLTFNPDLPFTLEFGRGSTWAGMAIVKLATNGVMEVVEVRYILETVKVGRYEPVWATTGFQLKEHEIKRIGNAIQELALCDLGKRYRDPLIADGTQWIFLIRQNGRHKVIFFDNYFPRPIRRFSDVINDVLKPYTATDEWKEISVEQAMAASKSLQGSLK